METLPGDHNPSTNGQPEAAVSPHQGPCSILIVDDHDQVRTALRLWLGVFFHDCEVLEADRGETAIRIAGQRDPSLILMDISLPGMDGLETTRIILDRQPDARILILSIRDELQYRLEAQAAGARGFVSKSSLNTDLAPAILKLLSERDER